MSRAIRSLALAVAGWLLFGPVAAAQQPTVEQLAEQVAQLKKQLAQEKARADELAALAEQSRAEAQAQRDQALKAEQVAREETRKALAALEAAQKRIDQPRLPAPGDPTPPALAQAQAEAEKALALLKEAESRLAELKEKAGPDNPQLKAQEERVAAARAAVDQARARVIQFRPEQPDVEKLRKELEAIRQEAQRAIDQARQREQPDRADAERRELLKRAETERERAITSEVERRLLLERVKQLEQRVAELEKLLRSKPGSAEPQPKGNPPAEQMEGLVKKVEGGLILITIGSDVGLQKGNTLEVFRLGNKPLYCGSVTVVEVKAKEAVVQPTGKLVNEIQAGDRVASRLGN